MLEKQIALISFDYAGTLLLQTGETIKIFGSKNIWVYVYYYRVELVIITREKLTGLTW